MCSESSWCTSTGEVIGAYAGGKVTGRGGMVLAGSAGGTVSKTVLSLFVDLLEKFSGNASGLLLLFLRFGSCSSEGGLIGASVGFEVMERDDEGLEDNAGTSVLAVARSGVDILELELVGVLSELLPFSRSIWCSPE